MIQGFDKGEEHAKPTSEDDRKEDESTVFLVNKRAASSIDEIARRIHRSDAKMIAIDGLPGAGKTTFANRLSARLSIRAVHLDGYLRRDCAGFTEYLRYDELRLALINRPVIVEGVGMLDVLNRLSLQQDQLIYVHAPDTDPQLDQSHPLVGEIEAYTDRFRPAEKADAHFVRAGEEPKANSRWAAEQNGIDSFLAGRRSQISRGLIRAGIIVLLIGVMFIVLGAKNPTLIAPGLATISISSLWIFLARSALR